MEGGKEQSGQPGGERVGCGEGRRRLSSFGPARGEHVDQTTPCLDRLSLVSSQRRQIQRSYIQVASQGV